MIMGARSACTHTHTQDFTPALLFNTSTMHRELCELKSEGIKVVFSTKWEGGLCQQGSGVARGSHGTARCFLARIQTSGSVNANVDIKLLWLLSTKRVE